jgi:high frequency lysogenization protein
MTSPSRHEERALALAGLVQAAYLVSTLARSGLVSQDSFEASLNSIFVTSPARTCDVYNGRSGVTQGIKVAINLIRQVNFSDHVDIVRYTLALLQLERKLASRPDYLRELGARVTNIDEKRMLDMDRRPMVNEDVVAELAMLYHEVLGNFEPRISVQGKQIHLQNPANINRIRALLLAGIRSAVLWRQLGGRRWQLIMSRKPLVQALSRL